MYIHTFYVCTYFYLFSLLVPMHVTADLLSHQPVRQLFVVCKLVNMCRVCVCVCVCVWKYVKTKGKERRVRGERERDGGGRKGVRER